MPMMKGAISFGKKPGLYKVSQTAYGKNTENGPI
jgi:hypothetical protein